MSTWFVNNTGLDLGKLTKLLGDYIRLKYDSSKVGGLLIAADPYVSDDKLNKLIVDSYAFDKITNYYVRIKLNRTPIDWHSVRQELMLYEYKVTLDCMVRGMSERSQPDDLTLINNEMQRIFGQYKKYDIPGIETLELRELGDLQSPAESGIDGWKYPLDIVVWIFKQNTS